MDRQLVFKAIENERINQEKIWGINKQQSLPGFLTVIQAELDEVKEGWLKNRQGKHSPLNELVQVGAVVVACLEKYGVSGSVISTDDLKEKEK